ncbi:Zinc finger BED domain-containing protein 1 [Portunus trituberculatus]|uniref:Zinc finger BED domain-containing protein 1 n=1 Tax=Portunus trituberculatus TaxID=210409 RepID=A0A5B7F1R4_PORTR|nr:Zinc finger BED domain-containing protein 1 [Portunus trituberculatus]
MGMLITKGFLFTFPLTMRVISIHWTVFLPPISSKPFPSPSITTRSSGFISLRCSFTVKNGLDVGPPLPVWYHSRGIFPGLHCLTALHLTLHLSDSHSSFTQETPTTQEQKEVVDNPDRIPECGRSELPTDECLPSTSKASRCSKGTKRQITKEDTSARVKSFKPGGKLDAVITDAILYMVCKDALPLSATENEGLKFLLKTTVPLYEAPGRKKITSLLAKKNSSLRELVEQQLSQATWVSVTADQASVTTKGYLVVSGHYIDSGCPQNVCLGVAKLTPGRTGEQIANDLTQILHSWNLETRKICSITTDGGANIIAAVRKLMGGEHSHIPCLAHLINQCVCQALSQSDKATAVIERVKQIVAYFQRSISASDALCEMQCQNGVLVPLELIEAVVTQWNSTFYLLERFNQLAGCISKVLVSGDHWTAPPKLTAEELAVVTDLVTVLRPFERATREVSGDKFITASKILPIVNCLQRAVANASFVSEDAMALNDALLDQIGQKLLPLEDNNLLASATVMDPRFKMIHFRSLINSDKILQWISREMQALTHGDASEDKNTHQSEVESNVDDSLWEIHDQLAKQTATAVELPPGSSAELHPELKLYLNMPTVPRAECPLRLWLDLDKTFPTLSRLAGKYLTAMGSAVASERIVSRLNATPTDLRRGMFAKGNKIYKKALFTL